jgi:hypothetical protein
MGTQGEFDGAIVLHDLFPVSHGNEFDLRFDGLFKQFARPLVGGGKQGRGRCPGL